MADNLNEAEVEDDENDEEVIDYDHGCIEAILGELGRASTANSREFRSIASSVTELSLNSEGFDPIYVLSDCINELQDLEDLDLE